MRRITAVVLGTSLSVAAGFALVGAQVPLRVHTVLPPVAQTPAPGTIVPPMVIPGVTIDGIKHLDTLLVNGLPQQGDFCVVTKTETDTDITVKVVCDVTLSVSKMIVLH